MLRGIRKTAEAMQRAKSAKPAEQASSADTLPGYGRARLWLGISAVGTMVVLSATGLFVNASGRLLPGADAPLSAEIGGLLAFVLAYVALLALEHAASPALRSTSSAESSGIGMPSARNTRAVACTSALGRISRTRASPPAIAVMSSAR
jgi:hypothetical protein